MKTLLKKTLVTAVAAATLTVGMVGTASAGAKAFSYMQITGLQIFNGNGDQYDAADFDLLDISDSSSTSAITSVNGAALNNTLDATAGGGNLDDNVSCVGTGCAGFGEDNYVQQASPAAGTSFARSDTQLLGAVITDIGNGILVNSATADALAEGQTNVTDAGTATSKVGTATDFSFSLLGDDTITFEFDATAIMEVLLHQDEFDTFASIDFSITIRDLGLDASADPVFTFSPGALNTSIAQLVEGGPKVYTLPGGNPQPFSATTGLLSGASNYQLTIAQGAFIDFDAQKVPEPASLALFALGLLGVSAARLSRKNKKLV
ncbi:EDSAP-1 family PEP-CTERM protein [Neptunomonas sp.]|uniref:EDSAP-1 family PEP-CTERM protein n=1 Tax=Neptunomonas sp. TaxID=1971898 RepID=UPI00356A1E5B